MTTHDHYMTRLSRHRFSDSPPQKHKAREFDCLLNNICSVTFLELLSWEMASSSQIY
jgi:hypothetical protein